MSASWNRQRRGKVWYVSNIYLQYSNIAIFKFFIVIRICSYVDCSVVHLGLELLFQFRLTLSYIPNLMLFFKMLLTSISYNRIH
jgi:hypothetical protein